MGTQVGTLEIEMAANIARLTQDFAAAKNEVNKSVGDIQNTVKRMQADIESSMSKVGNAVNMIGKAFAAVAVVTAGGAMFGKAIEESVKLTGEAVKLGKQLGITATEAGVLNMAMDDVHVSFDDMLAANQKITKTLGTNEMAFKGLGVATRDANGNFRSSLDVMLDVNTRLLTFKEGIDRNIEGQKIYGKQWGEVQGILRLTTDRMEDARQKSEALGMVIGKENVEATFNYRAAMNDVGDVISALGKAVGDALLPILTDLGNWFASIGPGAVMVVKGAIGGLAAAFYGLSTGVVIVREAVLQFCAVVGIALKTLAVVAYKALTLDWAGAKASFDAGAKELESAVMASNQRIVDSAQSSSDRIQALFSRPTPTSKKEGGEHSEGGEQKDGKTQVAEWKAQLEAEKEARGEYFKTSLAADEAFWQAKKGLAGNSEKDEIGIAHELYAIHKQIAQQKFSDEQEALKTQLDAAHQGGQERINIAYEISRRVGETYGWESKEYMASIRDIKKAADDFEKEQRALQVMKVDRAREHNVAMIDMERDQLSLRHELGQVSDQEEIAELKKLKEREYQIEVQAQQDKIALMKEEGTAKQQQLDDLAKMKDKHDAEMAQLDIKSVQAFKKSWDSVLGAINSAFEKSITGMIMGTQSLRQAMANIGQAILGEFVSMGVKRVTGWIANEAAMLFASRAKDTAVAASAATASTTTMASKGTEATAVVGSNAAEGAAGAAASQAAIPIIGPGLAIGAFAATMAMVLGAKALIHSSAGGEWNVPQDRLNLVHKNETILPANIATPLRAMVEGGGSMGGHTINITAMDSRDVHRALMDGGALHKALQGLQRNFTPTR